MTALGVAVGCSATAGDRARTYTPLLGAVAIAVCYGGLGPGLLACGLGWTLAVFLLNEPRFGLDVDRGDAARWAVSLIVALVITWIAWAMRRGRERAATAAGEAERTRFRAEQLHRIAASLSAAPSPEDVARAMVEGGALAVGASGASMGLVEGSTLRLLDPIGSARDALLEDGVVQLDSRSVIAAAAREGRAYWADDREQLLREFPATARALPERRPCVAVPLVAQGAVVGALGFAFDEPGRATEENLSLVRLVAEMGGSALERAFLDAKERDSRGKLEQILAVAPRFRLGVEPREIAADVCRSARESFAADAVQVWSIGDEEIEVVWREPQHEAVVPGSTIRRTICPC